MPRLEHYSLDARDLAVDRTGPITFTEIDEDGCEAEIDVPTKWVVCALCEGRGKHANPAIDAHGLSAEEMADDGFREDYMAGVYDIVCRQCNGRTTVREADYARMSADLVARYERHLDDEAAYLNEVLMERRMGA